jgi:hypothetical protein
MKEYNKPIIEGEVLELEDICFTPGTFNSTNGDAGVDFGNIF